MTALARNGDATRLGRLQRLVTALARALTTEEITAECVSTAMAELRADAAMVCLLSGTEFEIAQAVGFLPETLEQWRTFPLEAPLPAGDAIRSGEMIVFESLAERDARYPIFKGMPAAHEAFAIVPMVAADGARLGVTVFGFDRPHVLDDGERTFMRTVVDQCAQAINRTRLFEQQRSAAQHQRTLARAAQRLVRALTVSEAAEELAQVIVPDLGDAAIVHVADGGVLRIAAWAHTDEDKVAALRAKAQRVRYTRNPLLIQAARSGDPVVVTEIPEDLPDGQATDPEVLSLLDLLEVTSLVVVPLQARGRTVGTLTVTMSGVRRALRDDDVPFLRELGAFAAVVIDNAMLFEDRSRIAHTLQMTLLPPSLPSIPGLDLGATYRAAGAGLEVGGDFYDVFRADLDRWIIVIGDARGRGADAAATTGLARHIVRAAGFGYVSPTEVVQKLNRVLLGWHREHPDEVEPRFCAVNVIVLNTATWRVAVCCAGNPLPLLVQAGQIVEVGTPGTVAGVTEDPDLVEVESKLEQGDLLITYTDGISERRMGDRLFEDILPGVLTGLAGRPAAAVAEGLRQAAEDFTERLPGDDMAVVALRRRC